MERIKADEVILEKTERQKDKLIKEELKSLPVHYTIEVTKNHYEGWMDEPDRDGVEFYLTIDDSVIESRESLINEINKAKGWTEEVETTGDKESISTVFYYRVSNVMVHTSGGHLIMEDKVEVTNEEWESIIKGDIPDHLLYDN